MSKLNNITKIYESIFPILFSLLVAKNIIPIMTILTK